MTLESEAYLNALNGPKTVVGYPDLTAMQGHVEHANLAPLPTVTRPEVGEAFRAWEAKMAEAHKMQETTEPSL